MAIQWWVKGCLAVRVHSSVRSRIPEMNKIGCWFWHPNRKHNNKTWNHQLSRQSNCAPLPAIPHIWGSYKWNPISGRPAHGQRQHNNPVGSPCSRWSKLHPQQYLGERGRSGACQCCHCPRCPESSWASTSVQTCCPRRASEYLGAPEGRQQWLSTDSFGKHRSYLRHPSSESKPCNWNVRQPSTEQFWINCLT